MRDIRDALDDLRDYFIKHCNAGLQPSLRDGWPPYRSVKTSQDVCKVVKKPSLGYSETVEEVFASGPAKVQPYARFARIFIDWAMAFTILGACSVYVVLLVDSTKQMVDYFHPDVEISVAAYCSIFLLPLLVFTQIKNLKYLAPFSALANLLLVATFAICLYYIFQEFPDVSSRKPATDITKLPLYIGTVIFAMEGIGVVMPVENSMARPEHFLGCPGVLNCTMTVVVCLYTIMGFLGYVRYGDDARGSITLNLPLTDILSLMAKSFIIIAIFFTYTLQFYVPMEIVWRNLKEHITTKYHDLVQIVIRAFFTVITVAVAIAIPKLEQIIGLEGAFFYSFLGLICPAILEIIFCFERFPGRYYWRIWKNVIIIIFGTFVLVTGVTESIKELIYK